MNRLQLSTRSDRCIVRDISAARVRNMARWRFRCAREDFLDNLCAPWLQLGEIGERRAVERDSKGVPWQNWEAMQGEVA